MKVFIVFLLCLFHFTSSAQLTYIGDDAIQNFDGYVDGAKGPGLVHVGNKYYFISPNGKLYQTDGTQKNTKTIQSFSPQDGLAYLQVTNKYVYWAKGNKNDVVKLLMRYDPTYGVQTVTDNINNNSLYLNSIVVAGTKNLVDEAFINYEKDAFLVRKFTNDNFYIYIINDFNDNAKANLVYTTRLNNKNITTPISVNTELETYKTDVFCNGRENATGVYETTLNILKRDDADDRKYSFKAKFATISKGLFPFDRFLRTPKNIYMLYKVVDSLKKTHMLRWYTYNGQSITPTKNAWSTINEDVDTQSMDGAIYFSYKGVLVKYDEIQDKYLQIIYENNEVSSWQNVSKNKRFLKVGDYFMYRRNNTLGIYNYATQLSTPIAGAFSFPNKHLFLFPEHPNQAYAGNNSFYYAKEIDNKPVFIRYNLLTNQESAIAFPKFKKETFENIKAIYNDGDRFVFLTAYRGKKKKLLYKVFFYKEDGSVLLETKKPMETTTPIVEPVTVSKTFDIKSFNPTVFKEQLTKIINNQSNRFEDILGVSIPSELSPRYKSLVNIDGFEDAVIIDYSKSSQLLRYEATTVTIRSRSLALAFIDLLDKEVQNLVAGNAVIRVVDVDVKTRKLINFTYNGDFKLVQLDMYTDSNNSNPEEASYTITIRADKRSR